VTVVASTVALALCALSLAATPAVAGQTCGASSGHQICVTVASGTLSGHAIVTVTNVSNNGVMVAKWAPDGGATTNLIT
jgi:hypothetical protein